MTTITTRRRVRVEDGPKRIRVYLGGELIADTTHAKAVWEKKFYPVYYFPPQDVRTELLTATETTKNSPSRGEAQFMSVKGGDRTVEDAAYTHADSPIEEISGYIAFDWNAMDHWFEEDEEVFVHARDPYTRIDVVRSSRHVEVVVDGVKVADSHQPTMLFETGLPTRYYLPKTDVRMDLLTANPDLKTHCPYKGTADYWSVPGDGEPAENVVWSYKHTTHESSKIAGLVAFYDEKVDVYLDGELQAKPKSPFS
ncbi:MAG: DUF427 domain-containing protein [Acidimicrobiia bacterium]|nr:DUF427 domain-containing protein [Acidimicrobiia bacterium]